MGNMRVGHLNCINSSTCSSSMGNLHTLYSSVNMEVVHLNYVNSSACSSLMQNLHTTHSSVHIMSQFKLRKQWCIQYTFIEIKNIHPKTYM